MTRYEEMEKLEDEIKEAVNWHFGVDWDDIDAITVHIAADATLDAWDDAGWYEIMVGGHTWGYDDAHYYGERCDLGAVIFSAIVSTTFSSDVWAYKVTDPEDVAELEAAYC